jgi:hypothetical protein
MLRAAKITLVVDNWDLEPVRGLFNHIWQSDLWRDAFAQNDRVTVVFAEVRKEIPVQAIQFWVNYRRKCQALDVRYTVRWARGDEKWCRDRRTNELRVNGVGGLKVLQRQERGLFARKEFQKVIDALEMGG